jgi:type I restriction enzyme M protein
MLASMTPEVGRVAVVLPHGVLFRGGQEGAIRQRLLEDDLLEAVIGLGPNLFYGAGLPAAVLVFRSVKPEARRGRVLLVDASAIYTPGRAQNVLTDAQADEIFALYRDGQDVEGVARSVTLDELAANDHTLNIARYVQKAVEDEAVPVAEALADFKAKMTTLTEAEERLATLLAG